MESTVVILISLAVVAALAASATLLTRAGRVRAIAPVAAVILCVGFLVSAAAVRPSPHPMPYVMPHFVEVHPQPPGVGKPPPVPCAGPQLPIGPAASPMPAGAGVTRHPPFQIDGLPGAPGPVVLASQYPHAVPVAAATAGNVLSDLDIFNYVLASDSTDLFFQLEVGTPRAGVCAPQLVYSVLQGHDGTRTQRIAMMAPGPALARYNVVLACGLSHGGFLGACAWASTVDAPRRVFGVMWVSASTYRASKDHLKLSEAQIVALADAAFRAVDA